MSAPEQPQVREAALEDFDIQTRGPIHEAYSELYQANPTPGLLITKRPPDAIEELPPNIKPEGSEVLWIPGYWAWDDENEDFMWVSGIWRRPPPDHQWAPGYWATVDGGWQWVSGFWAREGENIVYRDPPPESKDQQLILDSASADQFWIPGCWNWQDGQYVWNDGYYAPTQDNWVWVPVRWRWTPRGYIRLAGYWDFRPTVRAMLFAPVVFRPGVLLRPRFVFTPRVVVDPWIALNHFWIRPNYGHYYFGNYYAGDYGRRGFHPYGNYFGVRGHWDPIFSYYQTFYRRQGIDFHERLNSWNSYYTAHADLRPPIGWASQREFTQLHVGTDVIRSSVITSPIADFAAGARTRLPLVTIDDRVRLSLGQADTRMTKQLLAHRELAERAKLDAATAGKASDLVNWSMPKETLPKAVQDLRRAGTPFGEFAGRNAQPKQPPRNLPEVPRVSESVAREREKLQNQLDAAEASRKAALKADMDQIRQRFGNDPVRFQQEMDRLNGRRLGEQPSITPRNKPIAPDGDSKSSLQGSGRSGGLGSPDFRLLPRSSGGTNAPKSIGDGNRGAAITPFRSGNVASNVDGANPGAGGSRSRINPGANNNPAVPRSPISRGQLNTGAGGVGISQGAVRAANKVGLDNLGSRLNQGPAGKAGGGIGRSPSDGSRLGSGPIGSGNRGGNLGGGPALSGNGASGKGGGRGSRK